MDNDTMRMIRRLVLLNTLYSFGSSFVTSMSEVEDGLDEMFQTATVKGQQLRGVFNNGQNNNSDREI